MATDWDQERRDAFNDFKEEGFPLRVIDPGEKGDYDPDNDEFLPGTPDTIFDTYGLQKSLKLTALMSLMSFSGGGSGRSTYQIGDTILYIPALGLPDEFDDRFQIEYKGKRKKVIEAISYAPGDVPLIFQLLIREPKNSQV